MIGAIAFFLLVALLVIFALVERLIQTMIQSMKLKNEIEYRKGQISELREQVRLLKEEQNKKETETDKEVEIFPI